ncbi:anthranilate phosphoribosyltransferase [Anaerobacterium chartisolvens]|uniref:Anthranilate phosphoribosyltransferase n=1 Tax=Anaerobacterium chartisolvens TaxID=1297424 RepID=A0A369AUA8_9FIRM|nr:anthranilate phosphoribosyltransferase [Anaerobacterium chartisolvens]RCX12960.1 anthranilate phosphoribosyltransferase [Anaerobacterium chartisolvens]
MLKSAIQKLVEGKNLSEQEAMDAMNGIMEGNATQAQIGGFITALRIKGETIEEITGCARVMRDKAERIAPRKEYFIDTCGTGGDGSNTFNISTAAAFVAAAGGVPVAKHGNRSVSSMSGSADVLEALGVNISLTAPQVAECVERAGIGFMFAPSFHKSMKYAAGPRRELGIRTIFNILGPLTNPANAKGQVLGVFDSRLTEPIANVLMNLGIERAMVIHGDDGLDEISITADTRISELKDGAVISYTISPESFGFHIASKEEILGGNAQINAEIISSIFKGDKGPKRDIVLLNASAALYVGKASDTLEEGIELSKQIIDSGRAMDKLEELKRLTAEMGLKNTQEDAKV